MDLDLFFGLSSITTNIFYESTFIVCFASISINFLWSELNSYLARLYVCVALFYSQRVSDIIM